MERFVDMLADRKDEIDEPMMDLLLSFSDFNSFKESMLFARAHFVATTPKQKSGKAASLGLKSGAEMKAAAAMEQIEGGLVGIVAQGNSRMQQNDMLHYESTLDGL